MSSETYRKVTAVRHARPFEDAIEIQTVPMEQPASGQVLMKNLYAGVNASDILMAAGEYLVPTPVPCDLGGEMLGEIIAVGDDVTDFKVGDYALHFGLGIGYREYTIAQARHLIPVMEASPEILSLTIGALTASIALKHTGEMKSTDTVLVTAAAGGTGQFAVQFAKLAGCHVIGTCSTDEKAEMLRSLGVDRVVNYKQEDLFKVLRTEYPKGVDLVFEGVGRQMFDIALNNLALFGRLLTIGSVSEYNLPEPERVNKPRIYNKLIIRNASVRAFNLNLYIGNPLLKEHMMEIVMLYHAGQLQPQIDPREFVGVEQVADAVNYLANGGNSGKVIVKFN